MAHLIDPMIDPMPDSMDSTYEAVGGSVSPESGTHSRQIERFDAEEQEGLDLAFEIAVTDPTEKDHLTASTRVAASRLKAAAMELVHSGLALIASLVGRVLLTSAARAVQNRGPRELGDHKLASRKPGAVQLSVLSIQQLLERSIWRRLVGRMRTLRMLGARRRMGEDGTKMVSLKLAERRYRGGREGSGPGYTTASDTPVVRAMLGVSIRGTEKPVYRVRRFMEVEPGRFTEMAGYRATDAEAAFIEYLSNPSLDQMTAQRDGESDTGRPAPGSREAGPAHNSLEAVRAA